MKSRVLVTGANGFIGRRLCGLLVEKGFCVRSVFRKSPASHILAETEKVVIGDIGPDTRWHEALKDVDCVIHLAARVHVMNDDSDDPLAEFRKTNVNATLTLARQAAEAGVKRFIYLSSIKVNGEETNGSRVFSADDIPAPVDPYAISKYEAEQALQAVSAATGMDVVIIRPPLVYGPGVKANFRSMMKWLVKGLPLPLGATHNSRSFVALDNMVDFIITCIEHPSASGQVFLVSDGDDMSTTVLLKRLSSALGVSTWLIPVPVFLLRFVAQLIGKKDIGQRLYGSLRIDISRNREMLNWSPPCSVDKVLEDTAKDFYRVNIQ